MKELSIKEKAKAYDEALERARKELQACGSTDCDAARQIFRLFSELKESEDEDERIRKALINGFNKLDKSAVWYNGITNGQILAWLEKQGEPVEINPTEFDTRLQSLIGKFESLPKEELIGSLSFWLNVVQNDGTYREEKQDEQKSIDYNEELKKCRENPLYFFDKYVKVKLKEQNPTWSEEDELKRSTLIHVVKKLQGSAIFEGLLPEELIAWLKSLKQRIKL